MTTSERSSDGLLPSAWSPFRAIELDGYEPNEDANIYFFGVCSNPVRPDSLVALAPVAHNGKACVCISFSCDGINWSTLQPLVACGTDLERPGAREALAAIGQTGTAAPTHVGHRSTSHPASNVLLYNGRVLIFIHQHVPGIGYEPTRLVRYSVARAAFAASTDAALEQSREQCGRRGREAGAWAGGHGTTEESDRRSSEGRHDKRVRQRLVELKALYAEGLLERSSFEALQLHLGKDL